MPAPHLITTRNPIAREVLKDESNLFIASSIQSLDDFLKTKLSENKHIYCGFKKKSIDYYLKNKLDRCHVLSISFSDGHTLYPPFFK